MDPSTGGGPRQSVPIEVPADEVGKEHRFWDKQPVPSVTEALPEECSVIDTSKSVSDVRASPIPLPDGFEWVELGEEKLEDIYTLLRHHYVEDDGACFRFDYTMECLRWALTPPGSLGEWIIGIRLANGKLVAFISAVPVTINVHGNTIKGGEVNFLCVHKKLRNRRLAPILIKEITRRINLKDVWHALYTAGIFLPRPVTDCRYYHRPLNFRKLVSVGFSSLAPGEKMDDVQANLALPETFTLPHIRIMEEQDVAQVAALYRQGCENDQIKLWLQMTDQEIGHWLLPRPNVVSTFVRTAEDDPTKITDFFSFYELSSSVLRWNQEFGSIKAAYSYLLNGTTLSRTQLLQQSLIAAARLGYDVFNALDLHHNLPSFRELKFGPGDGSLKYYLYNYKCPLIQPYENGVILL